MSRIGPGLADSAPDPLAEFAGKRILVVGDLMLDEFVWGRVTRISPEAPVPVVSISRRSFVPGGAANTAANVQALGGVAIVAGLVGDDAAGTRIAELLAEGGAEVGAVVRDGARPTTTKTRVIAHSQQVVRIDQDSGGAPNRATLDELLGRIESHLAAVQGCVVSDYGKGVADGELVRELIRRCQSRGIPVVIDPKGLDYAKYAGATVVKPNQLEAGQVLNRALHTGADIDAAGADLLALLGGETAVLVTRGPEGMTLFEPRHSPLSVPAQAREVYDVTGAGDTVAGVLAVALAAGVPLAAACRLASLAAAVVVGKVGTATCTATELRAARQVAR